ncbi:MAG: hypothetical protein ACD_2C00038G0007 [uncultured bacterium (gcode 4)]|uniref:Prepilin-type N-terminal cleavage/methylation domain-containing protein n=1 Tax=uncultured bacterium (gcode 4) TaxID=1234023 RepID=K2H2R8_9BACT|nr:MAG: hypothetical protein ACD_2C00038G0007 [uncultured bacterium (gcode 4)]
MNPRLRQNWFTLIEMIVAVTILAFVMLSVFEIYSNILQINKKLELNRILQENTRTMIEWLASEIRNKWIDYWFYWAVGTQPLDYSWNWNTMVAINNISDPTKPKVYCMQKVMTSCDASCYTDPRWCYLWELGSDIKLSNNKVEINNLRFYISWKPSKSITNEDKEWKVNIVFDLRLAPWKWISSAMAKENELHIQTTISEKVYKNMK